MEILEVNSSKSETNVDDTKSEKTEETPVLSLFSEMPQNCKCTIHNLPKWTNAKKLEKFLKENEISFKKLKKVDKLSFAVVTFENSEEKAKNIAKLKDLAFDGRKLAIGDEDSKKNKEKRKNTENGENRTKKQKENQENRTAEEVATPYAGIPYEEQLQKKNEYVKSVWKELTQAYTKEAKKSHKTTKGLPDVVILPVEPSPLKTNYRNKNEFSVGFDNNGKLCVGLNTGKVEKTVDVFEKDETEKVVKKQRQITFSLLASLLEPSKKKQNGSSREFDQEKLNELKQDKEKEKPFLQGDWIVPREILETWVPALNEYLGHCFSTGISSKDNTIVTGQIYPFSVHEKFGFWRSIAIRFFEKTNQLTLLFDVSNGQNFSESQLSLIKEDLTRFCVEKKEKNGFFLNGIVLQNTAAVLSSVSSNVSHQILWGSPYTYATLFQYQFRISAQAFFQVNIQGAEKLYGTIRNWISEIVQGKEQIQNKSSLLTIENPQKQNNENENNNDNHNSKEENKKEGKDEQTKSDYVVLDLCCGTGTIGICLSKVCEKVIGIELIPEAVEDAKYNAELNGVKNISFIAGKCEDSLKNVLKNHISPTTKCIAVVDPPRAGLHNDTVKAIRGCSSIEYVLFVSCHKNGLIENSKTFLRDESKGTKGAPFVPVKVGSVDMFPSTPHLEILCLFERKK